ncbi:hypothetical protein WH96_18010 [Kiloniella spongiae]|uniref:Response regulatory domain-containing protein n=1 Tax=Kiloniella spongiae TaxID=1489064 RepID=A0A0H2MF60_9PROT|nr:fused response regulator/phosphatase [Kiloniella spongiae]KLN59392.1 hypothetical protein WH96_18010 [Kiloniella spongiae]
MVPTEEIELLRYKSKILVVDDNELICRFISTLLSKAGFCDVKFVLSGKAALEIIEDEKPACVISDIEMPEMNGFQLLEILKSNILTKDIPVLVITAHDDRENRNEVLGHGASTVLSKPIDSPLLVNLVTSILDRKNLLDLLSLYHERLSLELELATDMQVDLLPDKEQTNKIKEKYNVNIEGHFQPSSELGGDLWYVKELNATQFMFFLADFSGHGISASINTFRLNTLLNKINVPSKKPSDFLSVINNELCQIMPIGQFCTLLCIKVDVKENTITYSGAAAPPFICITEDTMTLCDVSGIPLGIQENNTYNEHSLNFSKNSALFAYSDALYETKFRNNHPLGIEGVYQLVEEIKEKKSANLMQNILDHFYLEVDRSRLTDDLTTVLITR